MPELNVQKLNNSLSIPTWVIWIQCAAFVVLYSVWILPEIVGFRNTAMVIGAITGLYSIYVHRHIFFRKKATPIWLILCLFIWATFHLFFLRNNFELQLLEFKRIWKYAAIAAIFALGFGISLANYEIKKNDFGKEGLGFRWANHFWIAVYIGLFSPLAIYLIKYLAMHLGWYFDFELPLFLTIPKYSTQLNYVPKTDYVAFCLPPMVIALSTLLNTLVIKGCSKTLHILLLALNIFLIGATVFLFYAQDIKNGIAYAGIFIIAFVFLIIRKVKISSKKKLIYIVIVLASISLLALAHIQKNRSWTTLYADAKIAVELEKYQHWKYAGELGYPINEFGLYVSPTNYDRVAWLLVGSSLSLQTPLGYGLIEDSFKYMAKRSWPEASDSLSHSHSGWLDIVLGLGWPGFALLLGALFYLLAHAAEVPAQWMGLVFWSILAILFLWCTTEVSATVTFAALIFWICFCSGLLLGRTSAEVVM